MHTSFIPRIIIVLIGLIGLALGIAIGVIQVLFMFADAGSYSSLYPNTLSGAVQEMSIMLTNIWLALACVWGGLLYMVPVRIGRLTRVASNITPNEEVVPKAYRAGGIYIIIASILAIIARFLFSRVDAGLEPLVIIMPVVTLIIGAVGLFASFARVR